MLKSTVIASAILFGAAAPSVPLTNAVPASAEQTVMKLPAADAVIAQFSYLEISHGADGFELSVTDNADIFVNFEFPGDLQIRIGF